MNHYQPLIDEALKDGWVSRPKEYPGTVELRKDVGDGYLEVWFKDRVFSNGSTDRGTAFWFIRRFDHALDTPVSDDMTQPAESYSEMMESLITAMNSCDFCSRNVGVANLSRIAFANAACPECFERSKKDREYPGWNR